MIMTQEEKQLLLKDLSARLSYGVKIMFSSNGFRWDWEQTLDDIQKCDDGEYAVNGWGIHGIKPYLRPMSSMTEEERKEIGILIREKRPNPYGIINNEGVDNLLLSVSVTSTVLIDWLNARQFDYRGLIEKGLAIEVNESNNPYKHE